MARLPVRSYMPKGWPVVETGLFMTVIGRLMVTYADERMTEEAFQRYLVELQRIIRDWPSPGPLAVSFVHLPTTPPLDARRRRAISEILNAARPRLATICAGEVVTATAPVVRGILQAIGWLAPRPYPTLVARTPSEGLAWAAERLGDVTAERLHREYDALIAKLAPAAASSA